ncbi:MAG: diguanylate cyclase [Planctomycetes bacterium]|nr:diguanylate cyclase [Planctomycetota bacterium]
MIFDHRRDGLREIASCLSRSGYDVVVSQSLDQSAELSIEADADVVILNPLVVQRDGVEFEMLERLQRDHPVPVIVFVDSVDGLDEARHLRVPLRDFVLPPHATEEVLHRVELAAAAMEYLGQLHERAAELEGQVTNDFKTDLLSERHFRNLLHIEFKRAQRNRAPLSMLLIDVDNFKSINDTTDYAFGDEVLRAVAATLRSSCRETDFPARFGGDEFVVLLPQTTAAEAVQTGLRIRKRMEETTVQTDRYSTGLTVSIGIDTFDGRTPITAEEFRRRTNKALQEAKRHGKNQTWLYTDDGEQKTPLRSR